MKTFNLEAAKAGAKVCTRDGREARIICFDRKKDDFPIIALVKYEHGDEVVITYTNDGRYLMYTESEQDLMMVTATRKGYVNVFRGKDGHTSADMEVYDTKEEAYKCRYVSRFIPDDEYICTSEIEIEEVMKNEWED